MSLQELKHQVRTLPVSERLELVSSIIDSLKEAPSLHINRTSSIKQMKGLLKTDKPAPTDEEVETMLEERRVEKFLQ
jgi:hypothetical protein